jgi:release factor glutamine methyltransferase
MLPTVRNLTTELAKMLAPTIHPLDQRWFEAELILGFVLKQDRTWIALHPEVVLPKKQQETIRELGKRRSAHEPLAYLFKQAPFFGRTFFVDKRVLIPRPESEWIVKTAIETVGRGQEWVLWDVGTGSGCLALSIAASRPLLSVIASDCSSGALTVAKKNAAQLNVSTVLFSKGSLLTANIKRWFMTKQKKHRLILANLPYLPPTDQAKMQKQVADYEPLNALFAKDDGLELIKLLLQQLKELCAKRTGDLILLEHDPRQASKLLRYATKLFPQARITSERDQNNANRFTRIAT